eukprot:3602544-Amphidinium_carterae.1
MASYTRTPLVDAVHKIAASRPKGLRMPYLAVALTRGPVGLHVDKNYGISMTTAVGEFQGGLLAINDTTYNPAGNWIVFDPSEPHEVTPLLSGSRASITLYSPRHPGKIMDYFGDLEQLGFPVASWQRMVQWHRVKPAPLWPPKEPVKIESANAAESLLGHRTTTAYPTMSSLCLQPSCPSTTAQQAAPESSSDDTCKSCRHRRPRS